MQQSQGERVKAIRKALGLTLEEFGAKIDIGKSAASKIERGENNLSDRTTKAICREYNVSYDYLVYGEGEMFDDLQGVLVDELAAEYGLDDFALSIVREYLKLSEAEREVLKKYIRRVINDRKENSEDE